MTDRTYLKGIFDVFVDILNHKLFGRNRELVGDLPLIGAVHLPVLHPHLVGAPRVPQQSRPGDPHREERDLEVPGVGTHPLKEALIKVPVLQREHLSTTGYGTNSLL